VASKSALDLIEFEKDDPANWHIELINSVANLRARNYKINEIDKFRIKIIAGKIIPALSTTTTMIVGVVGVEILKLIQKKDFDFHRNSFMNLALPLWVFAEPQPAIQAKDKDYDPILLGPVKAVPPCFTVWDKILVQGPMLMQQFVDFFAKTYSVNVSIISVGNFCIYSSYSSSQQQQYSLDRFVNN